ncbi:MAG: hypothetical protein Q8R88_14325 [Desulfoprunum sp.]|nr:hypothetical protein [Desulfoprunum sp.]
MKTDTGIPTDISEEFLALQGFSVEFNRFMVLLDSLLPKPTHKDDPFASIILNSLNENHFSEVNPEVRDNVSFLMDVCSSFRAQQYFKNPNNKFKDTENIWLPIVLMGVSWNAAVSDLLSVKLPARLHSIEMIRMTPGNSKSKGSFTIELHPVLSQMDSCRYDQFKNYVKVQFGLSTTYSVESEDLEIIGNRLLSSEDNEDAQYLLMGRLPNWIEFLLENHYIKKIEITYPIRSSVAISTQSTISALVVIPEFPARWRDLPVEDQLSEIESLLGIRGNVPYYISLLSPSPEYYPIIDLYISRLLRQSRIMFSRVKEKTNRSIEDFLLARYVSFPPDADLRPGSDYKNLESFFEKTGADELLHPKKNLVISIGHFHHTLIRKIGDLNYLDIIIHMMRLIWKECRQEIESIKLSDDTPKQTKMYKIINKKSDSGDVRRIQATSSLSWATLSISLVEKNLNMLNSLLKNSLKSDAYMYNKKLDFLSDLENDSINSFNLLYRNIVKNALTSNDLKSRIESFAAILYLLDSKDVIEDSMEDIGYLDDHYVAAKLIETNKDLSGIIEVKKIANSFLDTIDARIDKKMQTIIQDKFLDWTLWLEKICQ